MKSNFPLKITIMLNVQIHSCLKKYLNKLMREIELIMIKMSSINIVEHYNH
jgi:hypothetical protein